jgi:putative chitinase
MTLEELMICTGAKKEHAERFLKPIEEAMGLYGIDTPQRQAGFLSQIGHESGGLSILTENLNYRVEALMSMFGRHRISEADCKKYGRTKDQPADQERIANLIYGGDWGVKNLGNTEPGDGWKYRGRGLKQLTGRDNYKRCGQALGVTLVDDPDRLTEPVVAALSAGWFWQAKGLNLFADEGDVEGMTKRINGGTIGLENRLALYKSAIEALRN